MLSDGLLGTSPLIQSFVLIMGWESLIGLVADFGEKLINFDWTTEV
jgi:hypothetical protein